MVPQFDNLDPDFSVAENLMVYGRYFGIAAAGDRAAHPGLLEFAGLAGRGDAKIRRSSGGMKRRLTLARALVNDPQVVFMDEPTTGLDPQARHLIWERLRRLTQEGKTLVLTTHFMEEAERLCHRARDHGPRPHHREGTPRALIAEHIEPQVVEVHGQGSKHGWQRAKDLAPRVERAGDTVFCYARRRRAAHCKSAASVELVYLHRPASLEDVFLKLTGRDLRD